MKPILIAMLAALGCSTAQAADGAWTVRVGAHNVDPDSASTTDIGAISADSAASLTLNLDYALSDHLTLDVLAALPFEHDLRLEGTHVGSARHLPPTVSLQYRFAPERRVVPYVAIGVNYTTFFDEELDGTDVDLSLDDSFGLAGQVGVDVMFGPHWLLGVDLRYLQIETDVSVGGADIGTVSLDPWVYGANLGYRF